MVRTDAVEIGLVVLPIILLTYKGMNARRMLSSGEKVITLITSWDGWVIGHRISAVRSNVKGSLGFGSVSKTVQHFGLPFQRSTGGAPSWMLQPRAGSGLDDKA